MEQSAPKPRGRPGRKPSQLKQVQNVERSVENVVMQEQTVNEVETSSVDRPSLRPPMRVDSRTAAARRTEEIMERLGGNLDRGQDEFTTPPAPDGWVYEWKLKSAFGMEFPGRYAANLDKGWEHVPAKDQPELMAGQKDAAVVERKGMYLMQIPKTIYDMSMDIEKRRAKDQMLHRNQQLADSPPGQFDRNHPSIRPKVNTSFSPISVPGDK